MSKIKFEVEIDATNGQHVMAVTNFLQAIGNTAEAATPAPKKETSKPASKPAELPKKETAKTEEVKKEPVKEEKPAEAPKKEKADDGISITEVRTLLATKVNDHRTEIKNQLTKLGATNVTTLDADKYQEFVDFLNSL